MSGTGRIMTTVCIRNKVWGTWYASVMMLIRSCHRAETLHWNCYGSADRGPYIWAQSGAVDLADDQVDVGVLGTILSHFQIFLNFSKNIFKF